MIYTHQNVDLDAILSVVTECVLKNIPITEDFIKFVPANCMEIPEYATIIDLEIAKHEKEKSHLEQYQDYLPKEIIHEVNIHDGFGYDPGSLQIFLMGLKRSGMSDIQLCQYFEPVVKGWIQIAQQRSRAKEIYESLRKVIIKGEDREYKFLVVEFLRLPEGVTFYAGLDGCVGTIYADKYNLGITRYPTFKEPNYNKLPHLKGWYQDTFLYCWGSRKAPAKSYPSQFINLDHFIEWLQEKFRDYKL